MTEPAKDFWARADRDLLDRWPKDEAGAPEPAAKLDIERITELEAALNMPLVLHGGSGSGDDNLARCAQGGVAKVNLYTDFIVAARDAVYEQHPDNWVKLLNVGDEAMKRVLRHYYRVLRCVADFSRRVRGADCPDARCSGAIPVVSVRTCSNKGASMLK